MKPTCLACGEATAAEANFCRSCGAAITPSANAEDTQALTRPIAREDVRFLPNAAKPVVPLAKLTAREVISIGADIPEFSSTLIRST